MFKNIRSRKLQPPIFVSGNLLASFPLELVYNHRIRQEYFNNKKYIFLNFGIDPKEETKVNENNKDKNKNKITPKYA